MNYMHSYFIVHSSYLVQIMKHITLLILLVLPCCLFAQEQVWDIPYTEILIDHNKKNHGDNVDIKNNQLVSTATVKTWTKAKNNMKELVDKINNRLTQAFIVLADATVLYDCYTDVDDIWNYQQKSFSIAAKYPWTIPFVAEQQQSIYNEAKQTVEYIMLIIGSYGDINKMQVSSRKKIFTQLKMEMWALKAKCMALYSHLQCLDLERTISNSSPVKLINKDKEIIKAILENF